VALRMEGEEGSCSAATPPPGSQQQQQQIRVVRCPRCDKLLPELTNYSVYVCGGCGATLQGLALLPFPVVLRLLASVPIGRYDLYISILRAFRPCFLVVVNQRFPGQASIISPRRRNLSLRHCYGFVGTASAGLGGFLARGCGQLISSSFEFPRFHILLVLVFLSYYCLHSLSIYFVGFFYSSIAVRAVKCFFSFCLHCFPYFAPLLANSTLLLQLI
jgi:DNA-directed RNA polymerase subunit RPC12/RpoP